MRERVHTFGDHSHLVGIYTEPAKSGRAQPSARAQPAVFDSHRPARHPGAGAPTVVYLNAGLLHRVGPYRLYVDLARDLAARGFPGFRFDMTGVGDSTTPASGRSGNERFAADVTQALDLVAREYQARRFILLGLCSGADYSHIGALRDDRVVGAVLLDGYSYPTAGFYLRHYGPRLASPHRVARFLSHKVQHRLQRSLGRETVTVDVFGRTFPPREQVAAELETLIARGVRLYFIYSGGQQHLNYRGQFYDMFPGLATGDAIEVDYARRADHTFTLLGDRAWLRRRVRYWLNRHFPPLPGDTGPDQKAANQAAADEPRPGDDQSEPPLDTESFVF